MNFPEPHFENKVFVNCPFDEDFKPFANTIFFTLVILGFNPQYSISNTASKGRLEEIKSLIEASRFSIHDLSRYKGINLGRFNMPFELGIDLGCSHWKFNNQERFITFMLDEEHIHDKIISDLSGVDPIHHNNDEARLIDIILDWFSTITGCTYLAYHEIGIMLLEWKNSYNSTLQARGHSDPLARIKKQTFPSIIKDMIKWREEQVTNGKLNPVYVAGRDDH